MSDTLKNRNEKEKIGFGNKTLDYLKQKSRTAIEKYTDTTVLYFQLDYEKSKKNFYGEILIEKWVNINGIEVNGLITVKEEGDSYLETIPNHLASLEFVVYIEHLKELGIWPQIGDYFSIKNRMYLIHQRSLLDSDKNAILIDKEAVTTKFYCIETDKEGIAPPTMNDEGDKNQINNDNQY